LEGKKRMKKETRERTKKKNPINNNTYCIHEVVNKFVFFAISEMEKAIAVPQLCLLKGCLSWQLLGGNMKCRIPFSSSIFSTRSRSPGKG